MTKGAPWAAAVLVLLSNAALAWRVLDNRAAVDATVTVTENEAPLVSGDAQNTAFAVRLRWDAPSSVSPDEAAALGFGPRVVEALRARTTLPRGVMPRRGWAVLEYGPMRHGQAASALRVVAVGPDPDLLRGRYTDRTRHVIVRADVGVEYAPVGHNGETGTPRVPSLRVFTVVPAVVAVPRDWRPVFDGLPSARTASARYRATIHWGRNHEPWMAAASRLP
jgi:hypothetical protein